MLAHEEIKKIVEFIEGIVEAVGKVKDEVPLYKVDAEFEEAIKAYAEPKMKQAVATVDKDERLKNMATVEADTKALFLETHPAGKKDINTVLYAVKKDCVRKMITYEKIRPDNRKTTEIRKISSEVSFLPKTHGTGLFTRGETQVLTIATLGAMGDSQKLDGISEEVTKRYMHHYNFPAYSVGEARPSRGPGRREIGHGALAERSLVPVLPNEEDFPYTIRLVSEVLSSNGSTSQASVCGSTLALLDAGVPIKANVAGIAMGLIKEADEVTVLTDIQGLEDFLGDMDFKVAGTREGITAIQMDMKIDGIDEDIIRRALSQAKDGRLFILDKMEAVIKTPRTEISKYAPRILKITIPTEKIREIIGPGGKTINRIIDETGVKIDIEDTGIVFITAEDETAANEAIKIINNIVKDPQPGDIILSKVVKIMAFGAFVELKPGKEGLLHISQIAKEKVAKVEDVLKVGDEVLVKVMEIDKQGRINLSRKALLKDE